MFHGYLPTNQTTANQKQMEEFSIITGLTINHEYWNVSTPDILSVSFSSETAELIHKLKIQYRKLGNTLHFLGHGKASQYLSKNKEKESINILLTLKDRNLVNYTDVVQSGDKELLYFSNQSGSLQLIDSMQNLPIRRSLAQVYTESPEANITKEDGASIFDEILIKPNQQGFARALDAMAEGIYTSSDNNIGNFYYQPKLVKGLFGVVSLNLDKISNPDIYQLNFKSREVRVAYRVKSKQHDITKLKVVDADSKINFEQKSGDDEMIFTSDQAVKLIEKPAQNFQLINGARRPLREHMSLGTTNNFKRYNQDGNQFLNEIFINI